MARVNSLDARTWAPEMLAYDVEAVPCLVLLDSKGMQAVLNDRVASRTCFCWAPLKAVQLC